MALKYSIAQDCRIGARRNNQDRIGYWSSEHALLMVVADGMGGHPRGELAAQIAVDRLVEDFVPHPIFRAAAGNRNTRQ